MHRLNLLASTAAASALLVGTLAAVPGATAAPARHASQASSVTTSGATSGVVASVALRSGSTRPPERYKVPRGIKTNNPLGDRAARRQIIAHLLHTINSTPGGQKIRFATWNLRSDDIVKALIAAHRRGVSVRVVIDRFNANPANFNAGFARLTTALKKGDRQRASDMTSYTRRCVSSCRSTGGIAHVKFYLFSKVRTAKNKSVSNVVMFGSANATDLAAYGQWNDLYTLRGKAGVYSEFDHVFNQMVRDRKVAQPYLSYEHGKLTTYFYPYDGDGTEQDPLLRDLGDIVCKGATGGTGTRGHTKIRIAQTSMWGGRGLKIAERLRQMWQRGCDIKIVYAVLGNQVLQVLRHTSRGPVPARQIAQDPNRDGVYDRYLHMKNMAVSGVYKGATNANVTWNGSANWTSVALASDEVVARIYSPGVRQRYASWVDYLYAHPPKFSCNPVCGGPTTRMQVDGKALSGPWTHRKVMEKARERGVDPYAKLRDELGIPDSVDLR